METTDKKDLSGHILGTYNGEKLKGAEREQCLAQFLHFAANSKMDPIVIKMLLSSEFDVKDTPTDAKTNENNKLSIEIIRTNDGNKS